MPQTIAALNFYDNLRAQGMSPSAARNMAFERFGVNVPNEPITLGFGSEFDQTIFGCCTGPVDGIRGSHAQ